MSNTFQDTINLLNKIGTEAAPVATDANALGSVLGSVDSVLRDIQDLKVGIADAVAAMTGMAAFCEAVPEIPGVGEILLLVGDAIKLAKQAVETCQGPFDGFVNDVVTPAQQLVSDAASGVGDMQDVLNGMATDIPAFTNTLAILNAMLGIGQGLCNALPGSDLATRLAALTAQYEALRCGVETGVAAIGAVLPAIATPVHTIADALGAIVAAGNDVKSALASVRSVASILDPIRSAFDTVESAFAPVRWAMDAVRCIMDRVITPVIEAVLDATGLGGLASGLEKKLTDALGINNVVNELTSALHLDKIQGLADLKAAGTQVTGLVTGWSAASTVLAQYGMNKDQARDQAMQQLAQAIEAAPPGDGPIQRWPLPPAVYTPPPTPPSRPPSMLAVRLDVMSLNIGILYAKPAASLKRPLSAAPAPALPPLGAEWKSVTDFGQAVDATVAKLATVLPSIALLPSKVAALPSSLALASSVGEQVGDVGIALQTAADFLWAVAEMPLPDAVDALAPYRGVLSTQIALCAKLQVDLAALGPSLPPIAAAVAAASLHAPTSADIASVIGRLSGWKHGAQALARVIDAGGARAPVAGSTATLVLSRQQLTGRMAMHGDTLRALDLVVDRIVTQQAAVDAGLAAYGQALSAVASIGQNVAAQGQPHADRIAHLLHVMDSLISPIAQLLTAMNCVAPKATADARAAAFAVKSVALGAAATSSLQLQALLKAGFSAVLPLEELENAVIAAKAVLSGSEVASLSASASAMGHAIDALKTALQESCTYHVPGTAPQQPAVAVPNRFLDDDAAQEATALLRSLAA